jgi:hypothetical protein
MKLLNLFFAIAVLATVGVAQADDTNKAPVAPSFGDPAKLTATAPETFKALFNTTASTISSAPAISPISRFSA